MQHAEPFAHADLDGLWRRPARSLDIVLADRARLAASIGAEPRPWRLVMLLAVSAVAATLPYGLVRGGDAWWRIAALYSGSVLLCYPSLQVFGAFLGNRLHPMQGLAMSLLIASVAAFFTLGFFPIVWFLGSTMRAGDWVTHDTASVVLLTVAFFAGAGRFLRCAVGAPALFAKRCAWAMLLAWLCLVAFVTLRMARELELLG